MVGGNREANATESVVVLKRRRPVDNCTMAYVANLVPRDALTHLFQTTLTLRSETTHGSFVTWTSSSPNIQTSPW